MEDTSDKTSAEIKATGTRDDHMTSVPPGGHISNEAESSSVVLCIHSCCQHAEMFDERATTCVMC